MKIHEKASYKIDLQMTLGLFFQGFPEVFSCSFFVTVYENMKESNYPFNMIMLKKFLAIENQEKSPMNIVQNFPFGDCGHPKLNKFTFVTLVF